MFEEEVIEALSESKALRQSEGCYQSPPHTPPLARGFDMSHDTNLSLRLGLNFMYLEANADMKNL